MGRVGLIFARRAWGEAPRYKPNNAGAKPPLFVQLNSPAGPPEVNLNRESHHLRTHNIQTKKMPVGPYNKGA